MAFPDGTLTPGTIQEYVCTYCSNDAPIEPRNLVISMLCHSHERMRAEIARLRGEIISLEDENSRLVRVYDFAHVNEGPQLSGMMLCGQVHLEEFRLKAKD
mgnify:CR=1 FL=1